MAILIRFFPIFLFAEFAYFVPPVGWQCAQPKNLSEHVQVGFIGESESGFRPSINLALEETDVSLKDYVKAVREIHLSQADTTWRDLGTFSMKGGRGRLTEISNSSPWGPVQMLQALLVRKEKAYILTAAALKKEFPNYRKEILAALKSLTLAEDMACSLPEGPQRRELQRVLSGSEDAEAEWQKLQLLVKECENMGSHWQFLVLKEGYAKIFPSKTR